MRGLLRLSGRGCGLCGEVWVSATFTGILDMPALPCDNGV